MKTTAPKPNLQPKTQEDLQCLIKEEIKKFGNQCDLNHIDVSLVTSFSFLFSLSGCNGDISKWDVSSALDTVGMFHVSDFNGDISRWNVCSVESMVEMFCNSKFNGDISKWNVSGVTNITGMFYSSEFEGDISSWNLFSGLNEREDMFIDSKIAKKLGIKSPSFEQVKSHFLSLKLEVDLKDASPGRGGLGRSGLGRSGLGKVRL